MYLNKFFQSWLLVLVLISTTQVSAQKRYALVVPYKPNEHFSDADQDIAQGSELTSSRLRAMIREQLAMSVAKKLSNFDSCLYFGNQTAETNEDLRRIYNSLGFRFVYSGSGKLNQDADQHSRLSVKNLFRKKEPKQEGLVKDDKVLPNDKTTRYYEAYITNPNLMPYLKETFQCDRIVFLSMFELKTRADLCLDKAAGIYQRELAVHFTVVNDEGKSMGGDVVRMLYPSNSNDLGEILNHTLPIISERIALEVR